MISSSTWDPTKPPFVPPQCAVFDIEPGPTFSGAVGLGTDVTPKHRVGVAKTF
jgi:hypothetical protein